MKSDKQGMQKNNSRITIDLGAIKDNIRTIRKRVGPAKKIMAVVKADAYGHGSVPVSRAIQHQVDWLAVNDLQEGIELRNSGIELPILVFAVPEADSVGGYREYDLTATVSHLSHLERLPRGCRYHLNFDTGMRRLGLAPGEAKEVQNKMKYHDQLSCTGIYSHFATADESGSELVPKQLSIFREILREFPSMENIHMENTGGTFFHEMPDLDMVRCGIGIYGYAPGDTPIGDLRPALKWNSYLVQVHSIKKGETVSYGATWEAGEDGYLGVLPVGYEDGLRRGLSGSIKVKIGDRVYLQVGRITMNYSMVFLGQERIQEGEEVEIINGAELTIEHWARQLDTIPYEILTSISPRIPRYYL